MAIAMHFFCPETRLQIWAGDWRGWRDPHGHQFFGTIPAECRQMERFLAMHRQKEIRYISDEDLPGDAVEFTQAHWDVHVQAAREEFRREIGFDPEWEDKWEVNPEYRALLERH